jgi:hypothetical protein
MGWLLTSIHNDMQVMSIAGFLGVDKLLKIVDMKIMCMSGPSLYLHYDTLRAR